MRGEKVELTCDHCGRTFERLLLVAQLAKKRYCCRACSDAAKVTSRTIPCPVCGKEFKVRPAQEAKGLGKYCSRRCFGRAKSGANNPVWTGGQQVRHCVLCGKEFVTFTNSKKKYCSQECGVGGRRTI